MKTKTEQTYIKITGKAVQRYCTEIRRLMHSEKTPKVPDFLFVSDEVYAELRKHHWGKGWSEK